MEKHEYHFDFLNDITVFDGVDGTSLTVIIGLITSANGAWAFAFARSPTLSVIFSIAFLVLVVAVAVRWATSIP